MYIVTAMLAGQVTGVSLQYDRAEPAVKAYETLSHAIAGTLQGPIRLEDNYRRRLTTQAMQVVYAMYDEVERSHAARNVIQILDARAQTALNDMASKDPALIMAAKAQQFRNNLMTGGRG
jgi:hypothetical protein